jgi:hypothetical protein
MGMSMRRLVEAANQTRWNHPALRNDGLEVTTETRAASSRSSAGITAATSSWLW